METKRIERRDTHMLDLLIWLIKLPFVLVGIVLMIALGLVGVVLTLVGVMLVPVLGVGLLIVPIGLVFLLAAWVIARLL
jgi:fatty acid desaturase